MRFIGIMATAAIAVVAAATLKLGIASIPDIKRYLKMRSM